MPMTEQEDRVRALAYQMWKQAGSVPDDDPSRHWAAAENAIDVFDRLEKRVAQDTAIYALWRCPSLRIVGADGTCILDQPGLVLLSGAGRIQVSIYYFGDIFDVRELSDMAGTSLAGVTDGGAEIRADSVGGPSGEGPNALGLFLLSFATQRLVIGNASAPYDREVRHLKNSCIGVSETVTLDCQVTIRKAKGSSHAQIEATSLRSGTDISKTLDDVLSLLRMAGRRDIDVPRKDKFFSEVWVSTTLELSVANGGFHELIPWVKLGDFVTKCFAGFRQHEQNYGLTVVLFYYCKSHTDMTEEVKFLFASVLMEALKFYWAKNVAQYTSTTTPHGAIKDFQIPSGKNNALKRANFKELMNLMAAHLNLQENYSFIDDRNAIFHSGLAVAAQTPKGPQLRAELETLHDQVDRILLTLLGYTGPFHPAWHADTLRMFP